MICNIRNRFSKRFFYFPFSLSLNKVNTMKYLAFFCLFLCLACDDADDNNPCTDEIVPGLHVEVKDATTSAVLTDGVEVTVSDGEYEETLNLVGEAFEGADERSANYIITVTKAGYIPFSSSTVAVPQNSCHVITIPVTVQLQPE